MDWASLTSDLRRRAELVYIVWEKSTAARPFFEACQHSAVRVWSIETQMDNLEDVAFYVAKAWHFGGLAETASVAASYPMGSTSNQDAPGEVWNPSHADEEDASVQVPYVIKWYAASDQLLHLMLEAAPPPPSRSLSRPSTCRCCSTSRRCA